MKQFFFFHCLFFMNETVSLLLLLYTQTEQAMKTHGFEPNIYTPSSSQFFTSLIWLMKHTSFNWMFSGVHRNWRLYINHSPCDGTSQLTIYIPHRKILWEILAYFLFHTWPHPPNHACSCMHERAYTHTRTNTYKYLVCVLSFYSFHHWCYRCRSIYWP
jgi:hypothetical protein